MSILGGTTPCHCGREPLLAGWGLLLPFSLGDNGVALGVVGEHDGRHREVDALDVGADDAGRHPPAAPAADPAEAPAPARDMTLLSSRSYRNPMWAKVRTSVATLLVWASIDGPFQLTGDTPIISQAITTDPVWSKQMI